MSVHWKKESKDKLAKEHGVDLKNSPVIDKSNRGTITGQTPKLRPKLGGERTNEELAKELGVTRRQASKIRNHKKPMPPKG